MSKRVAKIAMLAVALTTCNFSVKAGEIHDAAERGDLEKVKACLAQDAKQLDSIDSKGRTVLACAVRSGKKEVAEFLIGLGATEDIFAAIVLGHADKVATLIKQDPKLLNAKDSSGKAPLHVAALNGQPKIVQLLLAQKADINLPDDGGFTALHWAAMFDKSDVASVLLTNKADATIKVPRFGWTPLRLTVIHGHVATAEALLKGGADPNIKDEENIPLLVQAVIRGKKEMVELLLAYKAEVNASDVDGDLALDEAIESNNKELIDLLRSHGARTRK